MVITIKIFDWSTSFVIILKMKRKLSITQPVRHEYKKHKTSSFQKSVKATVILNQPINKIKTIRYWNYKSQAIEYAKKKNKDRVIDQYKIFCKQISHAGGRKYFTVPYSTILESLTDHLDINSLYLHEICQPESYTKIFLDLDSNPQENSHLDFLNSCYYIAHMMCLFLNAEYKVTLSVEEDVAFFMGNRKDKYSAHIIFNGGVVANDLKNAHAIVQCFISWCIYQEFKTLKNIKKKITRDAKCSILNLVERKDAVIVSSRAHIETLKYGGDGNLLFVTSLNVKPIGSSIEFTPMIDTQVYLNGSLRMYYSMHKFKAGVDSAKMELDTRLKYFELTLKKSQDGRLNQVQWKEHYKFSTKHLKLSLLQPDDDVSIKISTKNGKIKPCSMLDKSNGIKSMTVIKCAINDSYSVFEENTKKIILKYYEIFKFLFSNEQAHVKISKELKQISELSTDDVKKVLYSSGGSCTGYERKKLILRPVDNGKAVEFFEELLMPVYSKILNRDIKGEYMKPKISKIHANVTHDVFIINISGARCLITRKQRGCGHNNSKGTLGFDQGIFLVVNVLQRSFFQKCWHKSCKELNVSKSDTWGF